MKITVEEKIIKELYESIQRHEKRLKELQKIKKKEV